VKGQQGKLNGNIIFEGALMLFAKKILKLVRACRNYKLPELARFYRDAV